MLYCGFDCFSKTNELSTMVGKKEKKGVPQEVNKFHLQNGGHLQDEVVISFKMIPMTEFYQHLPKQKTKGI
jgi:hypothetical protein